MSEYYSEVFRMLLPTFKIYQYIVNKYYNKLVKVWVEYSVHQVHEYGWSISQSKRHYKKLICPYLLLNVVFGISFPLMFT